MPLEVRVIDAKVCDKWLKPCIEFICEIISDIDKVPISVAGFLLSEDECVLAPLFFAPAPSSPSQFFTYSMKARGNLDFNNAKTKGRRQADRCALIAPLDIEAVRHIEAVRERNPYRNVVFKLNIHAAFMCSNITTSHLYEVEFGRLPQSLREVLREIRVGERPPESIIVYSHNPEFSAARTNMWILSCNGSPDFLNYFVDSIEVSYEVDSGRWIKDFLPKLAGRMVLVIEVPTVSAEPGHRHLVEAVRELELAFQQYREGKYDSVVRSLRNIVMNHILTEKRVEESVEGRVEKRVLDEKIKNIVLANVPAAHAKEYRAAIKALEGALRKLLQDHLSKFVHLDTGKLLMMPLREDAEYLLMTVSSAVKYLTSLATLHG